MTASSKFKSRHRSYSCSINNYHWTCVPSIPRKRIPPDKKWVTGDHVGGRNLKRRSTLPYYTNSHPQSPETTSVHLLIQRIFRWFSRSVVGRRKAVILQVSPWQNSYFTAVILQVSPSNPKLEFVHAAQHPNIIHHKFTRLAEKRIHK
jgi:hypothetical protein